MKRLKDLVPLAVMLSGAVCLNATTPVVLLLDNFNANTPNTTDLNVDLARQTGTLAPLTYTMASGPGHYGHQLQNQNAQNQLLLADFPNSTSSLDFNFNGANSAGGLKISFDLDSIPTVYGGGSDNWGCINIGASQADQMVNVNGGQPHFGILFRGAGTIQAFDGAAVVSPSPEPVYSTRPPGTTNHIDLVISDADGNPFDGVGNTTIEVFANGGLTPVWSFTKAGGYANNYINVQGSFRAHMDNLSIAQLPANRTPDIANPSFEADTFTAFPGYVSGNGPITGWTALPGHGINPGTFGGPFTDNGAIPDGTKAAFLQEDGALKQVINGFSLGSTYQIRYFENARNCCGGTTPWVEVQIGGVTIVPAHASPAVGGSNPYREVLSEPFTATSTSLELSFIKSNPEGGDTTLLIDNVSIVAPGAPPRINVQPKDAIVALGDTATFTVGAAGSPPLSYQWYYNGDEVFGATGPTLNVLVDFPDVVGSYWVVVSNPSGEVTSDEAELIIRDVIPGIFNTGVDDTGLALPDDTIDPHYKLVLNADGPSADAIVQNSTVFPIVAGPWVANTAESKWIGPRVETSAAAGGDYTYRTTVDLAGFVPGTVSITGAWATDNAGLDIIVNGQSTGQANPTGFTAFTPFVINSGLQPGLNVIEFKLNNAAAGYTGLRIDRIRALGEALPPNTAPFVISDPQPATVTIGQTATFSVVANGSAPLSYQWYIGPDPLPGETGSTLSFLVDFPDLAGDYSVEITNPSGSVRSAVAKLTVLEAPIILSQPQSQVTAVGESATFAVVAQGAPPLSYQWTFNGGDIPGANLATFSLPAVTEADAGVYAVRVSNFSGDATSDNATLTVALRIPGLFNTGVDDSGIILADGAVDPHYSLIVNPDSASTQALVEDSTVFPIVTGPWVANGPDSKWIGPRVETSAAAGAEGAGGDYVYRHSFDLSGFDPATVRITGDWATDNAGIDILINGTSTGQGNTVQFTGYTPFTVAGGFQAGINHLDFKLNNSAVGYTGLRINNLRAIGARAVNRAPSFVKGANITVVENSGPQVIPGWATEISAGPGEASQSLTFIVTTDNPSLFVAAPAIDPANGNLSFTSAANTHGNATVTVILRDDGGTAGGGQDTSAPQTFTITVTPANTPPTAVFVVSPLFEVSGLDYPTVISVNGSNACVTLDGSLSSDPEGDALQFVWTLDQSPVPVATGPLATACIELGVHEITLTVEDTAGAEGTASQLIEVITASEAIDLLIALVNDADIARANRRPFVATLKAAQASFDRGNHISAVNQLVAFQNKVRAQIAPNNPELAMELIRLAQSIINAVEAATPPAP